MPIKKRNGNYQARLEGADGRILSQTFSTKHEAEDQLMKWKQEKREGTIGTNAERQMTVSEYFQQWFKDVSEETPKHLQSGWRERQNAMYKDFVAPHIGQLKLKQIRPNHVQRVLNEMATLGKAAGTRGHVFSLLRKMFGDAIDTYQYLTFNPALRKFKPALVMKEAKHLNLEQTKLLLLHVKEKKYGLAIWLQLYVGLRAGELQALRWEDIDLQDRRISVRRTYVRKLDTYKEYPKGRKQHSHALPPELWEMLNQAKTKATVDLVVTSPRKPGNVLPYRWYLIALRRYCKTLELPTLGTHGLRHSTSELYMSHGATKDDLRTLFAHSSMSVTERYLHGKDTNLEKVTNVIRLFG